MNPRSSLSPEGLLMGPLKDQFLTQKVALDGSVNGQQITQVAAGLKEHAAGLFQGYANLSEAQAMALASLMTREGDSKNLGTEELIGEWVQRVAFLRAVLAEGLIEDLESCLRAAAEGAIGGFSQDGKNLITAASVPGISIPIFTTGFSAKSRQGGQGEIGT